MRAQLIQNLQQSRDRHLIIVRYGILHPLDDEWVYNDADIDGSPVVWARDMGSQNRELVRYFHNRRIWLLEADTSPPALSPYVDDETVITQ